jgi:type II secretory pathway pseudopilin PulG
MTQGLTAKGFTTKGFTIVEALIALIVIGIVLAGFLPSFIGYTAINDRTELRTQAVTAAQQTLEAIRRQPVALLPGSNSTQFEGSRQDVTIGGKTFQTQVTYCARGSLCDDLTRHIGIKVYHQDALLYQAETVFTQLSN